MPIVAWWCLRLRIARNLCERSVIPDEHVGYVEPLLPPLRHPDFCKKGRNVRIRAVYDLSYLVHDFGAMCRRLKRHSRIVLVDMGASLE
jgi:hypothetical protein